MTLTVKCDYSDLAVKELKKVAEYLDKHAGSLVGDLDGVFVTDGGLRFQFDICAHDSIDTVTVKKEFIVTDTPAV